MRITIGQINPVPADYIGNANQIVEVVRNAESSLVVLPRFAVTGYGLGDIAGSYDMVRGVQQAQDYIVSSTPNGVTVVYGSMNSDGNEVVTVVSDGRVRHIAGNGRSNLVRVDADTWAQVVIEGSDFSADDVTENNLIVLAADPYTPEALTDRLRRVDDIMWMTWARNAFYVNPVGGQDDLVFDGMSLVVDRNGKVVHHLPRFTEHTDTIDTDSFVAGSCLHIKEDRFTDTYAAIVLGIRDYARKNGMSKAVLGASGGIDSALVLTMAADALGGENVIGVSMPSAYSSQHSQDDAEELMSNLGGEFRKVPISPMFDVFQEALSLEGVAEENLQARIRGVIVMGVSNTENALVLEPGNASETAVGYSTIYGDTVGGYAPICDVYKTDVYELARYRNTWEDSPIPVSSITKPPSAELKPGQVDSEALPDYPVLDTLLKDLFEGGLENDLESLYEDHDKEIVDQVLRKVRIAEWKRRQTALGPKVSSYSFSSSRNVPITMKK